MKVKPLYDRVVLRPAVANEKSLGGIMLPAVAQEKSQIAEVVAVGNGETLDGKESKMQVEIGQNVLFAKYSGTDIKVDGVDYIIVRQTDILAIINNNDKEI